MAKAIIGGQAIEVSLPNFKTLKAAWGFIRQVQESTDPMAGIDGILGVISIGAVGQTVTVDQLEERLLPSELHGLRLFVNDLMGEITPAGEGGPATEEASPSTATSTPSSAPSSPASDQPTGTA